MAETLAVRFLSPGTAPTMHTDRESRASRLIALLLCGGLMLRLRRLRGFAITGRKQWLGGLQRATVYNNQVVLSDLAPPTVRVWFITAATQQGVIRFASLMI